MRIAIYGFVALACLAVASVGGVMIARRHPEPASLVETSRKASLDPQGAPMFEPNARSPHEDRGRDLRTQVQVETSVLAALREQADQAQQDLTGLQQQKDVVRSAITGLQRQQDAARPAPAKQPSQQDPPRSPAQLDATPMPRAKAIGDRVVTRHGANVRAAPNKDAAVQRTVPEGVVLHVYSRSHDGWVQVGEEGPWGWIYLSLLDPAP